MLARRLFSLFSTQRLEAPRKYSETFSRARNMMDLYNLHIFNEGFVFVAPNATLVGDVWMGDKIAIWHGTVIRGDINKVTLVTNISIAATSPSGIGAEIYLEGDNVIQNNCTLYSCRIQKGAYVGHNSVIMEGAVLQKGCIIAPNSVVPPGRIVKERQVWGGNPIKYIRKALEQEAFVSFDYCRHSNEYSTQYNSSFLPYSNSYLYRHQAPQSIEKKISVNQFDQYEAEEDYNPAEGTNNRAP